MNSEEVRLICFANLHFYIDLIFKDFSCFLGYKAHPNSPLHLFPDLLDLKVRLDELLLENIEI